jgi:uncharacterized membrane protein
MHFTCYNNMLIVSILPSLYKLLLNLSTTLLMTLALPTANEMQVNLSLPQD